MSSYLSDFTGHRRRLRIIIILSNLGLSIIYGELGAI